MLRNHHIYIQRHVSTALVYLALPYSLEDNRHTGRRTNTYYYSRDRWRRCQNKVNLMNTDFLLLYLVSFLCKRSVMIETYIGLLALLALSPMSRMPAVLAVRQLPTYLVCGARGRRQSRATPKETRGARFGTGSEFLSSACCKKKQTMPPGAQGAGDTQWPVQY